jgi:hypothetical protein
MSLRPITEIERCLHAARRDVFAHDDTVAEEASFHLALLLAELAAHPEEVKRRAAVKAAHDERLLFRWT